MTLTSGVGVNEGHFILVIAVSLYVNPKGKEGGGGFVVLRVFIRVFYVVEDTMCGFYGGRGLN